MALAKELEQEYHTVHSLLSLAAEGLFDLVKLQDFLHPEIRVMNEEDFLRWVKDGAREPGEYIVTFQRHDKDPSLFISHELEIPGILFRTAEEMKVELGVPYAVSVVKEIYPNIPSSHAYLVEILREPTYADYRQGIDQKYRSFLKDPHKQAGAQFITQIGFKKGAEGGKYKVIGVIEHGEPKTVVPSFDLHPKPKPGESWIAKVRSIRRDNGRRILMAMQLYAQASDWTQHEVAYIADNPALAIRRYKGIKMLHSQVVYFNNPHKLEKLPEDLANREMAIFARLWNVYWEKEARKLRGGHG